MTTSLIPIDHTSPKRRSAIEGCILGTAAGDSIGLPVEGLSKSSANKALPIPLEQSLLANKGLLSDDTEHTVLVALSLLEAGSNVALFRSRLATRLRWWFLAMPPGVGSATARAALKLWVGVSPVTSGVYSAGNGPSMRSALLGVVFGHNPELLAELVAASSRLTHTDPKASEAALAVAVAAHCAVVVGPQPSEPLKNLFFQELQAVTKEPSLLAKEMQLLSDGLREDWSVEEFANQLGCPKGITGYSLHTVPAALYTWLKHSGDFRAAITAIVRCGGDTDSTAAITGAIVGAGVGPEGIPESWLDDIVEWPRNVSWMRSVAGQLASGVRSPLSRWRRLKELLWEPWFFVRNLSMFAVVVYVYFRRLAVVALSSVRVPSKTI